VLPIEHILPQLKQTLETNSTALLQAPPGAGKTTRVPLALVYLLGGSFGLIGWRLPAVIPL